MEAPVNLESVKPWPEPKPEEQQQQQEKQPEKEPEPSSAESEPTDEAEGKDDGEKSAKVEEPVTSWRFFRLMDLTDLEKQRQGRLIVQGFELYGVITSAYDKVSNFLPRLHPRQSIVLRLIQIWLLCSSYVGPAMVKTLSNPSVNFV